MKLIIIYTHTFFQLLFFKVEKLHIIANNIDQLDDE